jgi:substrate import-associated zinc metallohydrolase lipoprotein
MKKTFIYLIFMSAIAASCKKEEALNVDITKSNLDTFAKGPLDVWLDQNFLSPYNMEILYRFDRYQASIDKEIAPVLQDNVQPIMEGVKQTFINPYLEVTSKAFLLPRLPKVIALFGSGEYSDDQITLGTADAGRQINLYEVNSYDKDDYFSVMGSPERPAAFHTMHHEFAHILHQNIPVPPTYEGISSNYIGSSWVGSGNSSAVAKNLGFVTRYARNNKDEDFAEMISTLLVEGQDHFDAYVNTASDPTAVTKLRAKEQAVVDYFKSAYGIDFRVLQAKVRTAIETYAPVTIFPAINRVRDGLYKGFTVNKSAANQGTPFVTAYNSSVASTSASFGIAINPTFELVFANISVNRTEMTLKFTGGTFAFWYNMTATITNTGSTATIKLARSAQGATVQYANGTLIEANMKPILDYLTSKTFRLNWIENIVPNSKGTLLGFHDTTTGQLEFYSTVQK